MFEYKNESLYKTCLDKLYLSYYKQGVKGLVRKERTQDIVRAIGGKENIDTATHCVTRLRLVLKDDNKVDKDALDDNTLVKGQFKADNQYQIVIGPGTVDEVYKQFIQETGVEESSKDDAKVAASKKGNPLQRLIKLLGDILYQFYRH